jgi:hypothetical protein
MFTMPFVFNSLTGSCGTHIVSKICGHTVLRWSWSQLQGECEMKTVNGDIKKLKKIPPLTEQVKQHLADNIYKTLTEEGYEARDIIRISSELISLVTTDLEKN